MNYTYQLLRITVLFLAFSFGCNAPQRQAADGIAVQHKLGTSIVPENPERVLSLDIGAVETLHELGVVPVAVPKGFLPEYLAEVRNNDAVGDAGSIIEPNFEVINSWKPDLILISTRQERFYEELSQIAPTVFIGTDNKDYENSFIENTRLIAGIVHKEELAEEKLQAVRQKIHEAQTRFENNPNKALFLIYNNGRFSAFGKSSRFGFIHDVLHLKPALQGTQESVHGQRLSNELIADLNPDYLFIVDRNAAVLGKRANRGEIENKLIQQTAAYENGKVFYLDPEVWFLSGGGLISVELMVDDIVKLLVGDRNGEN